jgi:hypothetical protein
MNYLDYILFPIYVAIFYFIFSLRRKKYTDPLLRKYHARAFWIKIISTMAFTFFIMGISNKQSDSYLLYWVEGHNIFKLILNDPSNIKWIFTKGKNFDQALLADMWNLGYFNDENNYMVARLVTIFSFFTFGKYLIINLFFSMISFSGVWRLYRFFYELYPHLHKQLAIALLYLPTFVFWSSGILKDPICTGAMGWLTYSLYEMFYKKKGLLRNTMIVLLASYMLLNLKIYILISYVPFFMLFLILKNVNLLKNKFVKLMLGPALIVGCIFAGMQVMNKFQAELGAFAAEGLGDRIKGQQQNFKDQAAAGIGDSNFEPWVEFDGSVVSLVKMMPAAIITTLFRPFIWETRKLSTLLSSLESMALMLLTFWVLLKTGMRRFVRTIIKDPAVLYCFLFSVLFALFIGATTFNFGTLCRYKIPCTPFYLIAMLIIWDNARKDKKKSPAIIATAVGTTAKVV